MTEKAPNVFRRGCHPQNSGQRNKYPAELTTARARAVAIRLEGLDRRWRANAISVL